MPKQIDPRVAELMSGGMSYDAARMKVRRSETEHTEQRKPNTEHPETEQSVPIPNKPNTNTEQIGKPNNVTEQTEHAPETEYEEEDPITAPIVKAKDRAPFERRMPDETSEQFNKRWEGYSRVKGYDPSGRRPGWERTLREG